MRGYVPLLLLLAAIWGASFMFIKIAVEELEPTTTMFLRLAFSAIPLLALVVYNLGLRPAWEQLRAITKAAVILGIINTALPFTLIADADFKVADAFGSPHRQGNSFLVKDGKVAWTMLKASTATHAQDVLKAYDELAKK